MSSKTHLSPRVLRAGKTMRAATACLVTVTLLALPLVLSELTPDYSAANAYAADRGGNPIDRGGGGGGGGGGGKPDNPGKGNGDVYADLVVTYRDIDGLPIFVGVPEGIEGEEEVTGAVTLRARSLTALEADGYVACEQPITFVIEDDEYINAYAESVLVLWSSTILGNPFFNDADNREVTPVPLGGGGFAGEECDLSAPPNPDYTAYPQEVHFGRLNVGRSPIDVLSQQLDDVLDVLEDTTLGWDAAARLMAHGTAIDSPLQSLAVHRELLIRGGLGNSVTLPELPWVDPDDPEDLARLTSLELAAAALGAAADKGEYFIPGMVTLDLVVFNNRILQIPAESIFDKIYGDGEVGVNNRPYYDFTMYEYNRENKFPGCAYGITVDGDKFSGRIFDLVFGSESFSGGNVFGFATAADDSRRVIAYEHDTAFYIVLGIDNAGMTDVCDELGI